MNEKLKECSFLIPIVRDSDRRAHQPVIWKIFQDDLRKMFKGVTGPETMYRDVEAVAGEYEDPDTKTPVSDRSRRYTVAISPGDFDTLRGLLKQAAVMFDQKIIYLSIAGEVEFIDRPDEG
jgi:hypothetical protein